MNFIEHQTAWYNTKANNLNSVSKEIRKVTSQFALKRVKFNIASEGLINAIRQVGKAFQDLENSFRRFKE